MRVCELIVGLGDVEILGVDDEAGGPLAVPTDLADPRRRRYPVRPPRSAPAD